MKEYNLIPRKIWNLNNIDKIKNLNINLINLSLYLGYKNIRIYNTRDILLILYTYFFLFLFYYF